MHAYDHDVGFVYDDDDDDDDDNDGMSYILTSCIEYIAVKEYQLYTTYIICFII